ncbi:PAS domain S-box protein [Deinococcus deserti]|uniref:histidine kinase n=1 Tax=Deinococcus deserti (strain DSM 17065 / CIP 109153 / LMG 22923 / VCD115) TaxID=546414 RepID=C1D3U8_DEIDV|nr:PAS domain S-box protein [Deinococcus deserti]ACO48177.1 putative histidine kinase, classic [Deinococcus deserti VCD115]
MLIPSSNRSGFEPLQGTLLDALPSPTWILDGQGTIIFANKAYQVQLRLPEMPVLRQHFTEFLGAHQQDAGAHAWRHAQDTRAPFALELQLPLEQGNDCVLAQAQFSYLTGFDDQWLVTLTPLQTDDVEHHELLTALDQINEAISAQLDEEGLAQTVTDAAVRLTCAQCGVFIYTLKDQRGEQLPQYSLSGVPKDTFVNSPLHHMASAFAPKVDDRGILRADDITQDARFGRAPACEAMPQGSLAVRSFLAIPAISRSGEVIGRFFFSHERPGIFNGRSERLATIIAAQAASALDNTQLKQDARMNERRFQSLVQASAQIVWSCTPHGEFPGEQPSWSRFTGQNAEQQLGRGWLDAIHPDDRKDVLQAWMRAVETQCLYEVQHRLRRHDGQYRFMQARATPVLSDNGQLVEWIGTHEDVTERHEAEMQLREREERYRALVEYTIAGVTRISLDGTFIDVNPAAAAFLGYSQEQLAGMSVKDVTHPDDLNDTFAALGRVLSGEVAATTLEKRYVRGDGTIVWSNSGVTVVRSETGEPQYIIAVISNITERKLAEAELHRLNLELETRVRDRTRDLEQERRFLRALLESLAEGIVACDAHGQVNLFNDASTRFFGLPAAPLRPIEWPAHFGLYQLDGLTPLSVEEVPLYRALSGEQVRDQPIVIAPERAPRRYVTASGSAIFGPGGEKLGAVVALHDVTAQREAEQAVERVTQDLKRSNAELTRFAAVASHDLKAPLRTIGSQLQLLQRRYGGQLDEKADRMISFTVEAANRMDALIDDLLAYAQLGQQRRVTDVNAHLVMQDVLANLDATIQARNAHVSVGHLPWVKADETLFRQILQNLVGNALKFQPTGRAPRVRVSAIQERAFVHFTVKDNGIGIAPAYFDQIFEVFHRLHAASVYPGSGLGLAIVRKSIEEQDGRIWVESTEGEGAAFHFTLPAAKVTAQFR